METNKIKLEELIDLLPAKTFLTYVDYRDSFDDNTELIQKSIEENSLDPLSEACWDWFIEQESESRREYLSQLSDDVQREYEIDEDEASEVIEEYIWELEDEIVSRDISTPVKDLLRNTGRIIAHYDTGYYMESGSWSWSEAEIRLERMKIKKVLSINHSKYDKDLDMMIEQASGGGSLLIYFELDIETFTNGKDYKSVQFSDASIGIVNHYEGSGDVCDIHGHSFILPFNRDNVFLEKTIKYNWTYSIAGMCSDWCESTQVELLEEGVDTEFVVETSEQKQRNEREDELNKTFKSGSCTTGDMDISRHRNVTYINNFPCGNKCLDCGTFWID
jgi:hypothetical protein